MKLLARLLTVFVFCSIFLSFSLPKTHAFEMRHGERIVLSQDETFEESLFIAGEDLTIESTIQGDLYCAGQNVKITGEVTGDVLCAAQNIEITGIVGGNIRTAGQIIDVDAIVERNVTVFGQNINIGSQAVISGELYTAGEEITVDGMVTKSWGGAGEHISLNGKIEGKAQLATDDLTQSESATVAGGIIRLETDKKMAAEKELWKVPSAAGHGMKLMGKITGLVTGLVFGILIVLLFPAWLSRTAHLAHAHMGRSGLWGFGVWMVTPVLIVLSAITIVGIPLAMMLGFALMILGILSWVVASMAVGSKLLNPKKHVLGSWLAGFVAITLVSWIPVVGWIVSTIVLFSGSGAIALSLKNAKRKK